MNGGGVGGCGTVQQLNFVTISQIIQKLKREQKQTHHAHFFPLWAKV
jgi:hypothetical protein